MYFTSKVAPIVMKGKKQSTLERDRDTIKEPKEGEDLSHSLDETETKKKKIENGEN
jgi:hypothetical protein